MSKDRELLDLHAKIAAEEPNATAIAELIDAQHDLCCLRCNETFLIFDALQYKMPQHIIDKIIANFPVCTPAVDESDLLIFSLLDMSCWNVCNIIFIAHPLLAQCKNSCHRRLLHIVCRRSDNKALLTTLIHVYPDALRFKKSSPSSYHSMELKLYLSINCN